MSAGEIHEGDIGTVFEFTVKEGDAVRDLSIATKLEVKFAKPSGATVTKTLALKTDGKDGVAKWTTTQASDLDEHGGWQAQVLCTWPTGFWHSDIVEFKVYRNL